MARKQGEENDKIMHFYGIFVNLLKILFDKKGPTWRLADLVSPKLNPHVIGTPGSRGGGLRAASGQILPRHYRTPSARVF